MHCNYSGALTLFDFYLAWNAFKYRNNRDAVYYACFGVMSGITCSLEATAPDTCSPTQNKLRH